MSPSKNLKIGVLVSGRGSNLQSLIDACASKSIRAEIVAVLSNKADAFGLERARQAGIPAFHVPYVKGQPKETTESQMTDILNRQGVELVVLAGFMRLLSPAFIGAFKNRMINIHPSLLPAFPGLEAQKQAFDYGVRYSGCTVHFVDENCDTGPVILQQTVPVLPDDTLESLSERILKEEHRLLPKAVDLISQNKVKVIGRKTILEE